MLKQGQKLKDKVNGEELHVGGVCGEVYFLVRDVSDIAVSTKTKSEILSRYDLIEKKWEPEFEDKYWFFNDHGEVDYSYWDGSKADIFRRDNLGIYRTKEEVPTSYQLKK